MGTGLVSREIGFSLVLGFTVVSSVLGSKEKSCACFLCPTSKQCLSSCCSAWGWGSGDKGNPEATEVDTILGHTQSPLSVRPSKHWGVSPACGCYSLPAAEVYLRPKAAVVIKQ